MHGGTIVDASLIAAPKSTKNQEGKHDPEMHQTKKGNEWYFGMKVHAGADAGSGYVHTITGTSANMHDVSETANLIMCSRAAEQRIILGARYNCAHFEELPQKRIKTRENSTYTRLKSSWFL